MAAAYADVGQPGMFNLIVPGHLGRLSNSSFLIMLLELFRFAKWLPISRNPKYRGVLPTSANHRNFALFPSPFCERHLLVLCS
jgi:hypothetical protein